METFWALMVLVGAGLLIWFNIWAHDPSAAARKRRERAAARAQIVCQFCHQPGRVTVRAARHKKGISGGKATGAILTGGVSLLLTGLSRKESSQEMHCGNCGMTWNVA